MSSSSSNRNDDSVPSECVYEAAFAKSEKTDAILMIDGRKLHVNKMVLSYHSDYFEKLFKSDFKEKTMEEIEIKDVSFKNFATVLSLIHGHPLKVKESRVEKLLTIADRFLLGGSKRYLERLIIFFPNINQHQKLILADKYNLEDLLEHTLGLYNTESAYKDFEAFTHTNPVSHKLKAKLFDDLCKKL